MEKEKNREKKIVPRLRFPDFTESWEQRKLSSLASEFQSGKTLPSKKITTTGTYPVFGGNGLRGYTDTFNHDGYFALVGRQGALCGNLNRSVGKAYFTEHAIAVKANSDNDTEFLYQMMQGMNLGQYSGQSAQPGLAVGNISQLDVKVPSLDEQLKISSFLKEVDDTLALHQRELDRLKELKKGLLQKMFPQDGATVPEVRFPDFTESWEQCKLSDLGEILTGNTPSTNKQSYYDPTGIPWITPTDITSVITSKSAKRLSKEGEKVARIVPEDSILCTCIASIGKNTLTKVPSAFNQQINALVPNKAENDPYFLLTNSTLWSNTMQSLAAAQTMPIVNKTEFSKIQTYIPTLQEQHQLSSFFSSLDKTITLHQRRLDHYKLLKKGLLQQMFPTDRKEG